MADVELEIGKVKRHPEAKALATRAASVAQFAEGLIIKTDAQEEEANKLLAQVASDLKKAEALRRFFVDPYNAYVKGINDWFKLNGTNALMLANSSIRNALSAYFTAKTRKADDAKDKVEGQIARGEVTLEKGVAKLDHIREPEKTVRLETGTTSYRTDYTVEIVSVDELWAAVLAGKAPREFFMPNTKVIETIALANHKAKMAQAPGVKVTERQVPVMRSRM